MQSSPSDREDLARRPDQNQARPEFSPVPSISQPVRLKEDRDPLENKVIVVHLGQIKENIPRPYRNLARRLMEVSPSAFGPNLKIL